MGGIFSAIGYRLPLTLTTILYTHDLSRHLDKYDNEVDHEDPETFPSPAQSRSLFKMVVKLYGYTVSTCTLRVAVILKEKGVPFEFISVDMTKGAHKAPEFIAHQPFGQVPYIDDDGFILYESRAICRYIATKYASQGTSLIPTEFIGATLFEQAASIETSNYDPSVSGLAWELKFAVLFGGKTDEARVKQLRSQLASKLDVYDVILGKQRFLAGNDITLADLFHLPYGEIILSIGIDEFSSRPNVSRWWKDIVSRPSWQAVRGGI